MSESYLPPVSQLLILGLPEYHLWLEYAELGLSAAHVPELIELALDGELRWRVLVSAEVWAPIHAWRALGQLRAVEAASPLTQLFKNVDRYDDDWVQEELPSIFAMIGAATVPVLTDYLADDSNDVWARITAADSLARVGTAHADARRQCIDALEITLRRAQDLSPTLNGFIVSYLVDLSAVQAAATMEDAFSTNGVDLDVVGDWEDVQVQLGLLKQRITIRPKRNQAPGLLQQYDLPEARQDLAQQEVSWARAQRHLGEIGRNEPCWCGSGKKYKRCHMHEDQILARS